MMANGSLGPFSSAAVFLTAGEIYLRAITGGSFQKIDSIAIALKHCFINKFKLLVGASEVDEMGNNRSQPGAMDHFRIPAVLG